MSESTFSLETKRIVYEKWKGRCGFCGCKIVEQHHIIARFEDPLLTDDPDNLILLCPTHHTLTCKNKEDGSPMLSSKDISDLKNSKYIYSEKIGCTLNIPNENVPILFGPNKFLNCKYLLVVNGKPLIEVNFKSAVSYVNNKTMHLFIKLFDKENNFIGGMFGDYWASVYDNPWVLEKTENGIMARNKIEDIWLNIENYFSCILIQGHFFYDGMEFEVTHEKLRLNGNLNIEDLFFKNNECALMLSIDDKGNIIRTLNGRLI